MSMVNILEEIWFIILYPKDKIMWKYLAVIMGMRFILKKYILMI